jgi:SHS2 domain-containing protein
MPSRHEWIEHTGEVELELEASSEEELFAEGLRALAPSLGDDPEGPERAVPVGLEARDRATLLADWLGELVFLAESQAFLPERVLSLDLGARRLDALVAGRDARPRYLVKAVTYHRLALEPADGGFRARVTLDV